MRRFIIDQRTPLARPQAEALPPSARKPERKLKHSAYRYPGYGETKTSVMRESGSHVTPRVNPNDAVALGRMFPRKRARVLRALEAQGLTEIKDIHAVVQPRVFNSERVAQHSGMAD